MIYFVFDDGGFVEVTGEDASGRAGVYVPVSGGTYLPGRYDSYRAARYAFRFKNTPLYALQERKNVENGGTGGVITFADLQAAHKDRPDFGGDHE